MRDKWDALYIILHKIIKYICIYIYIYIYIYIHTHKFIFEQHD